MEPVANNLHSNQLTSQTGARTSSMLGMAATLNFKRYAVQHEGMVKAFNRRLHAAGETEFTFPESHEMALKRSDSGSVYQEAFVMLSGGCVHGAYMLKHQHFAIDGRTEQIAFGPQLPMSEGVIDSRFALIGAMILRDATRRQPLLFGLGMGGLHQRLPRMMAASRWATSPVPFFFKVLDAGSFLANIRYLRRKPSHKHMLDFLGATGIGAAGIRVLQMRLAKPDSGVTAHVIDDFGSWADALWSDCTNEYLFTAVRDAEVLNALYPASNKRFLRVLVKRHGRKIGWVLALNTNMANHNYFGNMQVGSIVDCLARAQDAPAVVGAATRFLEDLRPDLIVSNQTHCAWRKALIASGFMPGPSNCVLTMSPALAKKLPPIQNSHDRFHLNRGDGDGPINL